MLLILFFAAFLVLRNARFITRPRIALFCINGTIYLQRACSVRTPLVHNSSPVSIVTFIRCFSACMTRTSLSVGVLLSHPAEIFEPGLNKLFPDLDNEEDFPAQTTSMHHSPDGSMYWLGGQLGEIKKVRYSKYSLFF